ILIDLPTAARTGDPRRGVIDRISGNDQDDTPPIPQKYDIPADYGREKKSSTVLLATVAGLCVVGVGLYFGWSSLNSSGPAIERALEDGPSVPGQNSPQVVAESPQEPAPSNTSVNTSLSADAEPSAPLSSPDATSVGLLDEAANGFGNRFATDTDGQDTPVGLLGTSDTNAAQPSARLDGNAGDVQQRAAIETNSSTTVGETVSAPAPQTRPSQDQDVVAVDLTSDVDASPTADAIVAPPQTDQVVTTPSPSTALTSSDETQTDVAVQGTAPAVACGAANLASRSIGPGLSQFTLASACRANERVVVSYGGIEMPFQLDASGNSTFTVTPFLGADVAPSARYEDGTEQALPLPASSFNAYTTVAVVWDGPVQVDLHALEYSVAPGSPQHVWRDAASSPDAAADKMRQTGRYHGFLTEMGGSGSGKRAQIYTVISDGQAAGLANLKPGIVQMAVDYFQPSRPQNCAAAPEAETGLTVYMSSGSGKPTVKELYAIVEGCAHTRNLSIRLHPEAVPDIRVGGR
ncbi:MAG: hypothetical protein AAFW47_07960, partial [Pseudomonadota bacterium]